jgi:glycosyltransferase involved in cell wall biosynthesis
MSDAPTFSIITATFNAGALFGRTVESIRAQTHRDFEWIVMDGQSRDDTVERIEAAGDLVTHWVSEPDEGIADAWNKGLAVARGTQVLILNAGDTYDPEFLATLASQCDGQRVTCTHARLCTEAGQDAGVFRAQPAKLNKGMYIPHNWCAVPRIHYERLGPYRKLRLAMDFDWFLRYYRQFGAAGFNVIDRVLGTYHLGGTSDLNYAKSFAAAERVMVENGVSALAARRQRILSSFKHAVKRRILSLTSR